jgi:hypothetical protein
MLSHAVRTWRLSWPGDPEDHVLLLVRELAVDPAPDDAVGGARRVHRNEMLERVPALAHEHPEIAPHPTPQ